MTSNVPPWVTKTEAAAKTAQLMSRPRSEGVPCWRHSCHFVNHIVPATFSLTTSVPGSRCAFSKQRTQEAQLG